eukprot:7313812-Prorocentrum_lima.AAC.1
MTSSLVGSEMCIRDSASNRREGLLPSAIGSEPTDRRRRKQDEQASEQAVSYTHLTLPTICSV